MEKENLLNRWQVLLKAPGDAEATRGVLLERQEILHRLNELGEKDIAGVSIVETLEATNASLRKIDRASAGVCF
ncbi:MAG: hypothetical protein ABSE48_17790 [Verrucomicrobiota bacterium]|jgi:hypothetical protein